MRIDSGTWLMAALLVAGASRDAPAQAVATAGRIVRAPSIETIATAARDEALSGFTRLEGFTQREPRDGQPATQRTEVYVGYDAEALHVVFAAFDEAAHLVRARLRARERIDGDDTVTVMLDTFSDRRRAYAFRANPLGVQWDALWTESEGFDESFDTLWRSEGRLTADGYVVLFAIPFKSLRFPAGSEQQWNVVFSRHVPRGQAEEAFWPRVSSTVQGLLSQAAPLSGIRGASPGRHLRLIPYSSLRAWRVLDEAAPGGPAFLQRAAEPSGGVDAKAIIRDSVVLDLTANPDFGEIESDEPQVTVNERFEVFFPERRPFFIENSAYFETPLPLVFTRRIGDPSVGGRVTGKLGRWAFGALASDDRSQDDSAAFAVARVSRDVGRQSSIGALYTTRTAGERSNRVFGLDGRATLGDHWSASMQAAVSRTEDAQVSSTGTAGVVEVERSGRQLSYEAEYRDLGPAFHTDTGFVPRTDIRELGQFVSYLFRPEGRRLISWGPEVSVERAWSHDGALLDAAIEPSLEWHFPGRTSFELNYEHATEYLRPGDVDGLATTARFDVSGWDVEYETAFAEWFEIEGNFRWGRDINLAPPAQQAPSAANWLQSALSIDLRPAARLQIDSTVLLTRLGQARAPILRDRILRSRWNWQFTREFSVRAIIQHEATSTDARQTRVPGRRRANLDVLFTYRRNPWTAVYVGVNTNARDQALEHGGTTRRLVPVDRLRVDAWQFVTKLSLLVQF